MQLPNKKFLCYLYNRFSELRKDIRQSASRLASEFTLKFWNMYIQMQHNFQETLQSRMFVKQNRESF